MTDKTQRFSLLTSDDIYLFKHRNHFKLYEKMGSKLVIKDTVAGTYFCVWAPNASFVSVVGHFNSWDKNSHPLFARQDNSGIWEGFIANICSGDIYQYFIASDFDNYQEKKSDPFAFYSEDYQSSGSKVWDLSYQWNDKLWLINRKSKSSINAPVSIYEVHLGSWLRNKKKGWLSYEEIGSRLAAYCSEMGFTHVEIMPITEFPYNLSWGYQSTGYFAATSRFGTPQDLMTMIDILHQSNIGVILDWSPAHFPLDSYGLSRFDGTPLYEYADRKMGFHPDWKSAVFDYSKNEVCNFLISSAFFWLDKYHIDAIRVDAVSSMIYLDYSRKEGEWTPNKYGGKENIEAINFLRKLNRGIYENFDGVQTYAEESSAWPSVSKPDYLGGLGFGYKWNMGWMNDVLNFISVSPQRRKEYYHQVTGVFSYAFSENFLLPFSHDEVVYGKGSLFAKIPGTNLEKFDSLRMLLGYMFAFPGKKLLFMGCEFGQEKEWDLDEELDWDLLDNPQNSGIQRWIKDLNKVYRENAALYEDGSNFANCEVLVKDDFENNIVAFVRKSLTAKEEILCVFNFLPFERHGYKIGVDHGGKWDEILNSDAREYFGNGIGNFGFKTAQNLRYNDKPYVLEISIPPLGAVFFKHKKSQKEIEIIEELSQAASKETDKTNEINEVEIDENAVFAEAKTAQESERIYNIDGLRLFNYGDDESK
jgi:1,4-alpha-glucan branching enzyme